MSATGAKVSTEYYHTRAQDSWIRVAVLEYLPTIILQGNIFVILYVGGHEWQEFVLFFSGKLLHTVCKSDSESQQTDEPFLNLQLKTNNTLTHT